MLKSSLKTSLILACVLLTVAVGAAVEEKSFAGVQLVDEYQAPGLEMELSGIYPHPTDSELYYVLANRNPVYRAGQEPMLAEELRGQLLLVNRQGEVVKSSKLVDGDYGGLAYGAGHFFVASLAHPEILKVNPENGEIAARFPIAGPAGGLEYDAERDLLYAQLFVGHPHLAVIDPASGAAVDTLWSDESAMGLAKVDGDLLCTWSNGFAADAASELRLIDQASGEVKARIALDRVHTSMAPADNGFLSLVAAGDAGRVTVRRYSYDSDTVVW